MASSPLRTGLAITLALGLLAVAPLDGLARGHSGRSSGLSSRLYSSGHAYRSPAASSRSSTKCLTCERNPSGRIKRDRSAVEDFKRMHPRPPECSGCEVDHIVPLSKGGRDAPSNMHAVARTRAAPGQDQEGSRAIGVQKKQRGTRGMGCYAETI